MTLPLRIAARTTTAPLLRRFQVGEGMLLPVNASLALACDHSFEVALVETLLSIGVLALMYAVNDLVDAKDDLHNPRKDSSLAAALLEHRSPVASLLAALHVLATLVAAWLLGPRAGLVTAGVFATNLVYSLVFKGIRILDVIVVGLWGAAFAAIVGPARIAIVVGAMTAVSHVFQALGDRAPDLRAGLRTSAASPRTTYAMLAGASLALTLALCDLVPGPMMLLGLAPLLIGLVVRRAAAAWLLSKIAFAFVWLVVIHGLSPAR